MNMNILKSSEDYLEMMLMLRNKKGYVRSVDIAEGLGVTKPSVSYAVKRLRENGYINMDDDGFITLNEPGQKIAEEIYDRHQTLTALLMGLGVDEQTACDDACEMEHVISATTFQALKKYVALHPVEHNCDYCDLKASCVKKD